MNQILKIKFEALKLSFSLKHNGSYLILMLASSHSYCRYRCKFGDAEQAEKYY